MSYKLSVDVGGTFTDIVVFDDKAKKTYVTKVSSTPQDYSIGIEEGIQKISASYQIPVAEINYFIHGTTVATNALLERKGAKTALITTKGFRDVLEIGRQKRPDLYNFWVKRPEPPIPRYLVFEIDERTLADGSIIRKVEEDNAREVIRQMKKYDVESVAICFLNSYVNGTNELKMKQFIKKEMRGIHLCTSAETLPEIKEYERFCTTSVNAYLMPKVKDYIQHLENKRKDIGVPSSVHIMQSNGGIMSAEAAGERSVHTVFSGPAGGVLAAINMARLLGENDIVTIDIGGTSSDLALLHNYEVAFTTSAELGGFPVQVPMIEMHTIGAGGGSIAWVDAGSGVHVGPQSAGAYPGPACYGNGVQPTVSDANLLAGYLNPDNFLGGEMKLNKEKSIRAIQTKICDKTSLNLDEAMSGILRLVDSNMCGGINVISTQKGYDLRDFSLMAFGGGGSLHAAALMEELNMKSVIVPISPGNFSAIGCQLAKVRYDYVRTDVKLVQDMTADEFNQVYADMKAQSLRDMAAEGYPEHRIIFSATADMRYAGQSWELSVPIDSHVDSAEQLQEYAKAFCEIHTRTYGYTLEDDITFVNFRFSAFGVVEGMEFVEYPEVKNASAGDAIKGFRKLYFNGKFMDSTVYDREKMETGCTIIGPAIIEEYAASTPIPPKFIAKIDHYRNIIITREQAERSAM